MMIKHLRDILSAYWREHGSDHIRTQKIKLLIYDEYVKKYVSAEELLIRGEPKKVSTKGMITLNKAKELWIFDMLLKKFINPNLDLLTPGIKNINHISHISDFRTKPEHFTTSSADYFWGYKKGNTNRHNPKLPPVHDTSNDQQDSNSKVGWAGQVTKKPITNPRPERSNTDCSFDPGKDPGKKKPQKKKEQKKKLIVCNKRSKIDSSLVETSKSKTESKTNSTFSRSKIYQDEDCFTVSNQDIKDKSESKSKVQNFNCNLNDSQDITSETTLKCKKNEVCLNTDTANKEKKSLFKKICNQFFSNKKCSEDVSCKVNLSENKEVFDQSNTGTIRDSSKPCDVDKSKQGNEFTSTIDHKTLVCDEQVQNNLVCSGSTFSKMKDNKGYIKINDCLKKDTLKDNQESCNKKLLLDTKKMCKQNIKSCQVKTRHRNVPTCNKSQDDKKVLPLNSKYNFMVLPNTSNFQDCLKKIDITQTDNDSSDKSLVEQCKNNSQNLESITSPKYNDICNSSNEHNIKAITCMKSESNICGNKTDYPSTCFPELTNEKCKKQSKDAAVKEVIIKKRQELSKKSLKFGLVKPTKKEYKLVNSKQSKDNAYCKSQKSTIDKNINTLNIKKTKTLPSLQCQYIEQRVSEKLQHIAQSKCYNEVNLPVDLSKQKCGTYMGFKIKKSVSEQRQNNERCIIASKSKIKSAKKGSSDSLTAPNQNTGLCKSKSSKSIKSKRSRGNLKTSKSKKCLSNDTQIKDKFEKSIKTSKDTEKENNLCPTSANKNESVKVTEVSSNEINKKAAIDICCKNKINNDHLSQEKSKDCPEKMDQQPNESCTVTAEQLTINTDASIPVNTPTKNIHVDSSNKNEEKENINDKCQSSKETIVDQEGLKNEYFSDAENKNKKNICMDKKITLDVPENVKLHSTEEKYDPKDMKQSPCAPLSTEKEKCTTTKKESKIGISKSCTNVTKKSKALSKLSSKKPWKRNTSKESKKSRHAEICTNQTQKTGHKQKHTISKTQFSKNKLQQNNHGSKNSSMSTKNIVQNKTKRSNSRKLPCETIKSTVKQSKLVQTATICSKESQNLINSNKGNKKTKSSESVLKNSKTHSKKNRSSTKSLKEIKSTKMCSLQTLKKRVTEQPVKISKRVEIKSFSELKLVNNSPVDGLPIHNVRNDLCTTQSNVGNKYLKTRNKQGKENMQTLFENGKNVKYHNSSHSIVQNNFIKYNDWVTKPEMSNVNENKILKNSNGTKFSSLPLENINYRPLQTPTKSLNNKYFPKHITKQAESKLKTLHTAKTPQLYVYDKNQIIDKNNKTNKEYVSKNIDYFSNESKNNSITNILHSNLKENNFTKNEYHIQDIEDLSNKNKIYNTIVKDTIETKAQKQRLNNKCNTPRMNSTSEKCKNIFNSKSNTYVVKANEKRLDITNEVETQDKKYKCKQKIEEPIKDIKNDKQEIKDESDKNETVSVCDKHKNCKGNKTIKFITGLNTTRKCSIKNEFKLQDISSLHKKCTNMFITENKSKSSSPKRLSCQSKDTVNQTVQNTDNNIVTDTKTKAREYNNNSITQDTKYSTNKYKCDLKGDAKKPVHTVENKNVVNKKTIIGLKKLDDSSSSPHKNKDSKSLEKQEHTPKEPMALKNIYQYNNDSNVDSGKKSVKREEHITNIYKYEKEQEKNSNKICVVSNKHTSKYPNIGDDKKTRGINSGKERSINNTMVANHNSEKYNCFQHNRSYILNPILKNEITNDNPKANFDNVTKTDQHLKFKTKNIEKTETSIAILNNQKITSNLSPANLHQLGNTNTEHTKTNHTIINLEPQDKVSFIKSDQHDQYKQYIYKDGGKSNLSHNYPQFYSNTITNNNHHEESCRKEQNIDTNTISSKGTYSTKHKNCSRNIKEKNFTSVKEISKTRTDSSKGNLHSNNIKYNTEDLVNLKSLIQKKHNYFTNNEKKDNKFPLVKEENHDSVTRVQTQNINTELSKGEENNNHQGLNYTPNSLLSFEKSKNATPKSNTVLIPSKQLLGNQKKEYIDENSNNIKNLQYLKQTKNAKDNNNILKNNGKDIIKSSNKLATKLNQIQTSTTTLNSMFPSQSNEITNLIQVKIPSEIPEPNSLKKMNSTIQNKIFSNNPEKNDLHNKDGINPSKKYNDITKNVNVPASGYLKTVKKSLVDKRLRKIVKKHPLIKKRPKKNIKKGVIISTKNMPSMNNEHNCVATNIIPQKSCVSLKVDNLNNTNKITTVEIKRKNATQFNSFNIDRTNKPKIEDKEAANVSVNKTKSYSACIEEVSSNKIPKRSNFQKYSTLLKKSTKKYMNNKTVSSEENNEKNASSKSFNEHNIKNNTSINCTDRESNKFDTCKNRKADCSLVLQGVSSDINKAKTALAPNKRHSSMRP